MEEAPESGEVIAGTARSVGCQDEMRYKVSREEEQCFCPLMQRCHMRGAWVAQSVKHLTLAQVTILQFMSSGPTSGSVLTAQGLESALDPVSHSLCPSPTHALSLSLSLSQK